MKGLGWFSLLALLAIIGAVALREWITGMFGPQGAADLKGRCMQCCTGTFCVCPAHGWCVTATVPPVRSSVRLRRTLFLMRRNRSRLEREGTPGGRVIQLRAFPLWQRPPSAPGYKMVA
jgi:hypothetical protein